MTLSLTICHKNEKKLDLNAVLSIDSCDFPLITVRYSAFLGFGLADWILIKHLMDY